MKSYFLIALLIFLGSRLYSTESNGEVILSGYVKNFESKKIEVEDISETNVLKITTTELRFIPESNGHFYIKFKLQHSNYFRLGRNILYLSPGDKLIMNIDYNWPDKSTFTGDHYEENTFLKYRTYPAGGSYLESGDSIKATIPETIKTILRSAEYKRKALHKYPKVSKAFKVLEIARIKADILNSLNYLKFYFPYVHRLKGDSLLSFEEEYARVVTPLFKEYAYNFINPEFLKLEVYRAIIPFIILESNETENVKIVKDWQKATQVVHNMKSIANYRGFKDSFNVKVSKITTAKYREIVYSTYQKLLKYNGNEAINFVMKDSSGNSTNLNSFLGKYIYIDLWATWCGPCLEDMPYLDSLKNRYKHNSNLAIVSLSIDDDSLAWKKELIKKSMGGNQFIIKREKLESYFISEIPRVIIIGKNFEVVAMRGPLPSDKEINKYLENLLKD